MIRLLQRLVLAGLAAAAGGCALCANPDDEAYSAYGGKVERHDPYHGRVNSAFAPPGGHVAAAAYEQVVEESAEEVPSGQPRPAEMPEASEEEREATPMDTPDKGAEPMPPAAPEVFYE
jgi:hypothetical protein